VYSNTFTWNGDTVTPSSTTNTHVEIIGNGWVRVHATWTTTGNGSFQLAPGAYANYVAGDSTLYWGMNLQQSVNYSGSYIPSDTRFVSRSSVATYHDENGIIRKAPTNAPRYGYKYDSSISKWVETGLILELASTNLFPQYTTANRYRTTIANNTSEVKSPDGGYSAMKLTPDDATAFNYTVFAIGNNSLNGSKMCGSIYAKAGTNRYLWMSVSNTNGTPSGEPNCTFDLQTGTVVRAGDVDIAEIEPVADGWYRCSVGHDIDGNGSSNQFVISIANTTGARTSADYLYLAFPQIESGTYVPTSYIHWDGSGTTTRSADVATSPSTTREQDFANIYDISTWYNPDESTIYGEATSLSNNFDTGSNPCLWGITDGTSNNRYLIRRYSNDVANDSTLAGFTFRLQIHDGTTTIANNDYFVPQGTLPEWDDGSINKAAMSIKLNSQIASANGIDAQMSSITAPRYDTPTMAQIGFAGSSAAWNGHIRKISYYPAQLNITELKALTENN
jgi:hypothetical protein